MAAAAAHCNFSLLAAAVVVVVIIFLGVLFYFILRTAEKRFRFRFSIVAIQ